MNGRFSRALSGASIIALLFAAPALAQEAADDGAGDDGEEIVVTGTSIRGVAPAGAQAIGIDEGEVTANGAISSVQLLSSVPQLSEFNGLPTVLSTGSATQQAANRPAVRGLTSGASGGSPTLILMDGHRLPGAGIVQTVTDPDIIPPSAIQRVEVVTDGGSSVYGADAVGGVINFITRKDFDGLEVSARQGFGDEYQSFDATITAGTNWAGGSAYLSYNYAQNDAIFGRDRDYVRRINYTGDYEGLPVGRSCNPGSVLFGTGANAQDYNIDNSGPTPTFTLGDDASVRCDLTDDITIYPQQRRDSWFGGFSQDLTDDLNFDLRAWYTNRLYKNSTGANYDGAVDNSRVITDPNDGVSLATDNVYYVDVPGHEGEPQTVFFNFGSIPGLDQTIRVQLETWGFSPSLTYDLGHDWQARGFLNYGHSVTKTKDPRIDTTALADNFANINFYNLGATDSDILRQLTGGNITNAYGEDEIVNGRLVLDGPLFSLPAGQIRAAFGVEYLGEAYESEVDDGGVSDETRRSRAVFAEVNIPIVSAENNIPLIESLDLSLSARHDMYSDFGEVTTPRIGLTYEPISWIRLRGTWGESFQAPSLADTAQTGTTLGASTPTSIIQFALPFTVRNCGSLATTVCPGVTATDRLMVIGGAAALDAQRAETYSVGFDLTPPIVENLELSATYYNIEYTGQIGSPPVFLPSFYTDPGTQQFFLLNTGDFSDPNFGAAISEQAIRDYLAVAAPEVSQSRIDEVFDGISPSDAVTMVVDFRRRNLGATKLSGIDASARYTMDTDFGSIYFNASGTYRLNEQVDVTGLGFGPNGAGVTVGAPRWGGSATLGATVGDNFRGQATLVHSGSQRISPTAYAGQEEVEAYDVVNMFFQYDVHGQGLADGVSLSLGLNNVFDNDPSSLNGDTFTTHGYVGGNLGRVIQIGLTKRL